MTIPVFSYIIEIHLGLPTDPRFDGVTILSISLKSEQPCDGLFQFLKLFLGQRRLPYPQTISRNKSNLIHHDEPNFALNIQTMIPASLALSRRRREDNTRIAREFLQNNRGSPEILALAIYFLTDIESDGAPPNLSFLEEKISPTSIEFFLFSIPIVEIFFHRGYQIGFITTNSD